MTKEHAVEKAKLEEAILEREKIIRKGTHIADGIMWCPSCGGHPVSNGHSTCRNCNPNLPLSIEEYRVLQKNNEIRLKNLQEAEAEEIGLDDEDDVKSAPDGY